MKNIIVTENESDQRLDRFLRKLMPNAQLGFIYKSIRKNIKVNGVRAKNETMLNVGDVVSLYISDNTLSELLSNEKHLHKGIKRSFSVVYEDENVIMVVKPVGLLTHGDSNEKKNTLVNQVVDYLIEKGEYIPRIERVFSPAAVNRLDRNTSGIVIFGKNSAALRELNKLIRMRDKIEKYYLTVIVGELAHEYELKGRLIKEHKSNIVEINNKNESGKIIETKVDPLAYSNGLTLAKVRLITGRTHQIRAHLAYTGYPILGDSKYGSEKENKVIADPIGLNCQLLHAYKLKFDELDGVLSNLSGKTFVALPKGNINKVWEHLFPEIENYII